MMLSKIDDFMPQKSDSGKITGAKQLETRKGTEKVPFRPKSGDHGPRSPATIDGPGFLPSSAPGPPGCGGAKKRASTFFVQVCHIFYSTWNLKW